jgi:hypothetical protein
MYQQSCSHSEESFVLVKGVLDCRHCRKIEGGRKPRRTGEFETIEAALQRADAAGRKDDSEAFRLALELLGAGGRPQRPKLRLVS